MINTNIIRNGSLFLFQNKQYDTLWVPQFTAKMNREEVYWHRENSSRAINLNVNNFTCNAIISPYNAFISLAAKQNQNI